MTSYFVGVDGGGTKTRSICISSKENGEWEIVGEGLSGSTNWNSVGTQTAQTNLLESIHQSLSHQKIDKKQVRGVCLGMSGVDRHRDKLQVADWIKGDFKHLDHNYSKENEPEESILVYNDAVAALSSGTNGDLFGVVVISGTGMIVVGFKSDRKTNKRSGGWGPLLGDEGGGYSIGQDILQAVVRSVDGTGPSTMLLPTVLEHLKLSNAQDLIGWAYNENDKSWKKIADLAPLASICATKGDNIALSILDNAAEQLLLNISATVKGLNMENGDFPLVFAGGNLTHEGSKLASLLQNKVVQALPKATVKFPAVDPAVAAALLARNKLHEVTYI